MTLQSLEIAALARAYAEDGLTPETVLDTVYERIAVLGVHPGSLRIFTVRQGLSG
jgi:hypothetical protein